MVLLYLASKLTFEIIQPHLLTESWNTQMSVKLRSFQPECKLTMMEIQTNLHLQIPLILQGVCPRVNYLNHLSPHQCAECSPSILHQQDIKLPRHFFMCWGYLSTFNNNNKIMEHDTSHPGILWLLIIKL